jgi:hypothetical protein
MLQCVLDDDVLFFLGAITFSCMLQCVLDDDVLFLDDRALFFIMFGCILQLWTMVLGRTVELRYLGSRY